MGVIDSTNSTKKARESKKKTAAETIDNDYGESKDRSFQQVKLKHGGFDREKASKSEMGNYPS